MITVFIEEEYGYRYWVWETGMDADALIAWWKTMDPNTYFFSPVGLPGKVFQIWDNLDYAVKSLADDPTVSYEDIQAEMVRLLNEGEESGCWWADEDGVKQDLTGMWKAHLHMEEDTWLKPPDNERIFVAA